LPANSIGNRVLLTADQTLMSDYHKNIFIGFGTCAPSNFIPDKLYSWLFFPPIKSIKGIPVAAPYGLRKIEAQLLSEGFNVLTVAPTHLEKYIRNAKVLGIYAMDPFGLGPASTTLAFILKKEPFLAQCFRNLLENPCISEAKNRGMKIIVGGPGVWQFRYRPKFVEKWGIDCIIEGEAEKVVGKIVRAAINDVTLPQYYEVGIKETPSLEEIPEIKNPSINGLVEIGRGCCRGCDFCSVTLRPLRWYSYEKILQEINVNVESGYSRHANLHAEDVMLYGSKNTIPNDDKLIKLHKLAVEKCDSIGWSHCSLTSIAVKPKLFARISEIILQKQPWWGAEIGIETGSPKLAKRIMRGKAHPFKPEKWPEVVRTGMGLAHDYKLIPACTLIVGVPGETEDDLLKTIELVEDLKDIRSLIVPSLFFVPMGKLKDEEWFKETEMTPLHKELLIKCLRHGFRWVNEIIKLSFTGKWYANIMQLFYKVFAKIAEYNIERKGITVKAGK